MNNRIYIDNGIKRVLCLDVETTSLRWDSRLLAIGWACLETVDGTIRSGAINVGMRDLFNTPPPLPQSIMMIREMAREADILANHNQAFDLAYLMKYAFLDENTISGKVYDTMTMGRCTGGHESHSLIDLMLEAQIIPPDEMLTMKSQRRNLESMDPEQVLKYARMDAENTLSLFDYQFKLAMSQYSLDFILKEGDFIIEVAMMRFRGIGLDRENIAKTKTEKAKELNDINRELIEIGIHGPNSANTLNGYIVRTVGANLPKTGKGNYKSDEETLDNIAKLYPPVEPIIKKVLRGRRLEKQISTWLDGFLDHADERGKIHPLFGSTTVSNRLSCTEPNAQAVQTGLHLFKADDDYIMVEADFDQAELRVGAGYAGEDKMAQLFADNIDIHWGTAVHMFPGLEEEQDEEMKKGRRRLAKTGNFTGFYGGGAGALAENLGIDIGEGKKIVTMWRKTYPNVVNVAKRAENKWIQTGFIILAHGKRLWASPDDIERRPYKAFNQLVQGSIAEIIKEAMLAIRDNYHRKMVDVVNQVHDSLYLHIKASGKTSEELAQTIADVLILMQRSAPEKVMTRTNPPITLNVSFKVTSIGDNIKIDAKEIEELAKGRIPWMR